MLSWGGGGRHISEENIAKTLKERSEGLTVMIYQHVDIMSIKLI